MSRLGRLLTVGALAFVLGGDTVASEPNEPVPDIAPDLLLQTIAQRNLGQVIEVVHPLFGDFIDGFSLDKITNNIFLIDFLPGTVIENKGRVEGTADVFQVTVGGGYSCLIFEFFADQQGDYYKVKIVVQNYSGGVINTGEKEFDAQSNDDKDAINEAFDALLGIYRRQSFKEA